jgi:uncharacterized protein (DUF2062 family)
MILRIRLCIPTYNNPLTLEQVVVDCLRETDLPVLVVDDGSDLPVENLFRQKEILLSMHVGRLQILRFVKNRGKGAAIQAAIADSLKRGFTHLLTMDADGQHLAREVKTLVSVSKEEPLDLILANRTLVGMNVPLNIPARRRVSHFLVRHEAETRIRDSGSGFRIYPLVHVQNMRFWSKRFDFEIEVLIRLLWKSVTIREVDAEVCHTEPKIEVSRFHRFTHNVRVSILNSVLATLALLKTHRTPGEVGAAVGAGVFIGCTPFFGFHTFLAIVLSFFFRLNFVYVWLGTQISNPFLAGFLTVASVGVGKYMIKSSSQTLGGFSLDWLIGSVLVGGVLGIVSGFASYFVANKVRSNFSA